MLTLAAEIRPVPYELFFIKAVFNMQLAQQCSRATAAAGNSSKQAVIRIAFSNHTAGCRLPGAKDSVSPAAF
jgi:hypothetical protein